MAGFYFAGEIRMLKTMTHLTTIPEAAAEPYFFCGRLSIQEGLLREGTSPVLCVGPCLGRWS